MVFMVILFPFYSDYIDDTKIEKLQVANILSQIIMSIFAIFGVIVALWQYIIYSRSEIELKKKEIYDIDKARIQKAIDLLESFKVNIIEKMNPIVLAFNSSCLSEIADKIPAEKMIRFDMQELRKCLSEENINKITKIGETQEFIDVLIKICLSIDEWNNYINEAEVEENGKPIRKITVNKELILNKYQQQLQNILNDMEYFSMNFIYGTADEKVVYQSLHNAFIYVVEMLYVNICMNNEGPAEQKLYTNLISLYKMWKERSQEQIEKEFAAADQQIIYGKKLIN